MTSTATTAATNGRLPAGTDLEDLFGVEIDQTAATPQEDVRLAKYDAACVALAEAHRVDEAREIRDRAVAVRAYAKQARNTELARWAVEIQLRAERRCGELLREMAEAGQRQPRGRPNKTSWADDVSSAPTTTLADLGISRDQSSEWQAVAALSESEFDNILARRGAAAVRRLARDRGRQPAGPPEEPAEVLTGTVRATITEDGASIAIDGSFASGAIVDRLVEMAQRCAAVELVVGANRITFRAAPETSGADPAYLITTIAASTFEQALGLLRSACPPQRRPKPKRAKKRRGTGIRGSGKRPWEFR